MLTKRDYEEALLSQGACNLSGLAHSLSGVVTRIWEEARARGEGTDHVNNHPIVRLYLEQMLCLCRLGYYEASIACEQAANASVTPAE